MPFSRTCRQVKWPVGILLFALLVSLAGWLCTSCSKDRIPVALPDTHTKEWMSPGSPDFHGRVVIANSGQSCVKCHGSNFDGGISKKSCLQCHAERTTGCIGCHGGLADSTGAPPVTLRGGNSDTTLAVGAHGAHLHSSGRAAAVACNSCHAVPAFILDSAHLDRNFVTGIGTTDSIAEVRWGGFSNTAGNALWDRQARTCSQTYCHGDFTGGNNANAPIWTGSNQAACGSCHDVGSNPAALTWKHDVHVGTFGLKCADCHANVVNLSLAITNPTLHVNGLVDTLRRDTALCNTCHASGSGGCTMCHGGTDNLTGAPPKDLRSDTASTSVGVGAHTRHMEGGDQADSLPCSSCHIVPASVLEAGHLGSDSVAEITWGNLSNQSGGANWNRTARSCSLTYCHGNFTGGKASNTPVWTSANQAACGSCHDTGADPASLAWKHDLHVGSFHLQCADCHASVVDTQLTVIDKSLHVNGVVDMLVRDSSRCDACHGSGPAQCTSCHGGTDNLTGAPPTGLRGETATSNLSVGAHTKHMQGGTLSDGVLCNNCHIVPSSLSSAGHWAVDSVAEVIWGDIANLSGGAVWNRTSATCAKTYCHGNFSGGQTSMTPIWTAGNQAPCGSCHDVGSNPSALLGEHETHIQKGYSCYRCHSSVVNSSNQIAGPGRHVDGMREVVFWNGIGTYTSSSHSCSNPGGCHGTRTWQNVGN